VNSNLQWKYNYYRNIYCTVFRIDPLVSVVKCSRNEADYLVDLVSRFLLPEDIFWCLINILNATCLGATTTLSLGLSFFIKRCINIHKAFTALHVRWITNDKDIMIWRKWFWLSLFIIRVFPRRSWGKTRGNWNLVTRRSGNDESRTSIIKR
jgi:hypothetical protein